MGLKAPLNGQRVIEIIYYYSLAFFDLALKGKPTTLLECVSPAYPELEFRSLP
jgi:hypothetical protein